MALLLLVLAVALPGCSQSPSASGPATNCRGVEVAPGADLQALIDANPPRTTFCFARGLYVVSGTISISDKSPTLDLRAGAVIDGQNGSFIGIDGPDNQLGMRILGGVFQHFGNAEAPDWVTSLILRRNSIVKGTEFRENFNAGVGVQGSNARVSNAYIHDNGMYGLVVTPSCADCSGPTGVIIEDTEIAFNNTRHLPTGIAAGGTKFVYTKGMIVRGNDVHDNYGSGLWWDGYNTDANVYGNHVYGNRNWGIFWELSYGGARIHNNTLTDNGMGDGTALSFFNNVQLLVSASDGTDGGIRDLREHD